MQTTANYQKPENWLNFGDMNPKRHGGLFVRWERDMWHIIQTYHPDDLPEDFTKGRFRFNHYWLEESDIWVDGKPENGFTEWAESEFDSFSHKPFDIVPENELPEGETMASQMNWVVENHIEWVVGSLAYSFSGYYTSHRDEFDSDYWDYLSHYGIDESNF